MQFSLILTTVLCFTAWMNLVQALNEAVIECPCVAISNTQVTHSKIKGYNIQKEGICSIGAVVFRTVGEKTICSNPNSSWAKHIIRKLEARITPRPMKTYPKEETTSGTTPSASTKLCSAIKKPSKPRIERK